mmetsp:Transcript_47230/g.101086  ORF Transcript_47230/g.101086 Transcript_47230/m.101086 type:complete len:214 (-) Transcript_47230:361-1002(-)
MRRRGQGVAQPISGSGIYWKSPQHGVGAQACANVMVNPLVISKGRLVAVSRKVLSARLAILNGCHCIAHEPNVEHQEATDHDPEQAGHAESKEKRKHGNERDVLIDGHLDEWEEPRHHQQAGYGRVDQHKHKILVVVESHAVVDPGAVVVHSQYARAAHPAVVASIRLISLAPLATAALPGPLGLPRLHGRCRIPEGPCWGVWHTPRVCDEGH